MTNYIARARTHTHTHNRAPLDEGSARRRGLCLYNTTLTRDIPMPPAEFELGVPASEPPQAQALDRAATGIGAAEFVCKIFMAA